MLIREREIECSYRTRNGAVLLTLTAHQPTTVVPSLAFKLLRFICDAPSLSLSLFCPPSTSLSLRLSLALPPPSRRGTGLLLPSPSSLAPPHFFRAPTLFAFSPSSSSSALPLSPSLPTISKRIPGGTSHTTTVHHSTTGTSYLDATLSVKSAPLVQFSHANTQASFASLSAPQLSRWQQQNEKRIKCTELPVQHHHHQLLPPVPYHPLQPLPVPLNEEETTSTAAAPVASHQSLLPNITSTSLYQTLPTINQSTLRTIITTLLHRNHLQTLVIIPLFTRTLNLSSLQRSSTLLELLPLLLVLKKEHLMVFLQQQQQQQQRRITSKRDS